MKFPRIPHLPESPGGTRDDRRLENLESFLGRDVPFVVTVKMDGSNVCMTRDGLFARSHNGPPTHSSFNWLKGFHASMKHEIPNNMELFCEYTYAVHSIEYAGLPSFLWLIAIRHGGKYWTSFRTVDIFAQILGIPTVPVLTEGIRSHGILWEDFLADTIKTIDKGTFGVPDEGFVISNMQGCREIDFQNNFAKWVRKDHVQTDEHWMHKPVQVQRLG